MNQKKITIIDYGMGNLHSISNALSYLGYTPIVTSDNEIIEQSDAIILPGVGAFGQAMHNLNKSGLDKILTEKVVTCKTPFLGICLGMQLLAESSDEKGHHEGLGWIPGHVKHLPKDELRVPHVGWNHLDFKQPSPLYANLSQHPSVYFVHSHHFECEAKYIDAVTDYGMPITASIIKDNIHAVQYHPEKSHHIGLTILQNFMDHINASKDDAAHA